jgi:hypothetical protein
MGTEFENRLVAFVDILGWSAVVQAVGQREHDALFVDRLGDLTEIISITGFYTASVKADLRETVTDPINWGWQGHYLPHTIVEDSLSRTSPDRTIVVTMCE